MAELSIKELGRLSSIGKAYVNEEFLKSSDHQQITDPDAWSRLDASIAIDGIKEAVDSVISTTDKEPNETDGHFSEELHRSIFIPRRFAVDSAVWHFITCLAYPEYVRYRWTRSNGSVSKERFLGGLKRNAFARLWWAAELLHQGDDYSLVHDCFSDQDLYEAIFGRSLSKYQLAARTTVEQLKGKPRSVVRDVAKRLNMLLSTYLLEDLDKSTLTNLIIAQCKIVESG